MRAFLAVSLWLIAASVDAGEMKVQRGLPYAATSSERQALDVYLGLPGDRPTQLMWEFLERARQGMSRPQR
jgi:hypothetical protein